MLWSGLAVGGHSGVHIPDPGTPWVSEGVRGPVGTASIMGHDWGSPQSGDCGGDYVCLGEFMPQLGTRRVL